MPVTETVDDGIAEVVMDNPPVNALTVADARHLAELFASYRDRAEVRVAILTAVGKGFSAGIDIKEYQDAPGHEIVVESGAACHAAFGAVHDCAVPVIAAVQDFCLATGVGLAGSADVVIASKNATFGLPEVDNGALGVGTHLARLVPTQRMRHMFYTCEKATAEELAGYGSVLEVTEPDELMDRARAVAATIAAKSPAVIRAAKRALLGIEPVDVHRAYRYEQGFTYELNLLGEGDKARDAFVRGERRGGGDPSS